MVDPCVVAHNALALVQLIVRKCDEVKSLKKELAPLKNNLESLGGILQGVGRVDYKTDSPLSTILHQISMLKIRLPSVLILCTARAVNDTPNSSCLVCKERAHQPKITPYYLRFVTTERYSLGQSQVLA